MSVPPVPSPATKRSTRSSAAAISAPVPSKCARGFASFAYWKGMKSEGSRSASSRASRTAPFEPSSGGESTISAP